MGVLARPTKRKRCQQSVKAEDASGTSSKYLSNKENASPNPKRANYGAYSKIICPFTGLWISNAFRDCRGSKLHSHSSHPIYFKVHLNQMAWGDSWHNRFFSGSTIIVCVK